MKIRISARQSDLARLQAFSVGEALEKQGHSIEYFFRESLGDKNLTDPLWKMPEKGVFTEDFFEDLVQNRTDLVVHSWKDLPTDFKPETFIAATLPRADQRDLLVFKKSSRRKKTVQIFSSSPRRAFNLNSFLKDVLPWPVEDVRFESVRGNIPTRLQKLMANDQVDGLILAKAALDRLLTHPKFSDTAQKLRTHLAECDWMVLPLSENPNAAAQGALAIEILSSRKDLKDLLRPINCEKSFLAAERERQILKEFGGGCHLALGISVLHRPYGTIEIVRGKTPSGELINSKKLIPNKVRPTDLADVKVGRLDFELIRTPLVLSENFLNTGLRPYNALVVAKSEAATQIPEVDLIWTAGVNTWKKLAAQNIWVHGCFESLGEHEPTRMEAFYSQPLKWARWTHDQAAEDEIQNIPTYKLELKVRSEAIDSFDAYVWRSASEFNAAYKKFPDLKHKFHICGPGRTLDALKKENIPLEKIAVELDICESLKSKS